MNTAEQIEFVEELSRRIAGDIIEQITTGKIPDNWDGHELRALLAERHQSSAGISSVKREPRSKRAMEYRNTIVCNNL